MHGKLYSLAIGTVALVLCLSACAQQPPRKVARIGYLAAVSAAADAPRLEAFRQGLRELGYVEGENILIDYRHEARGFEPLPEIAAELVQWEPDVLVGVTTNAAQAVQQSTTTIPIVFMGVTDPVTAGLVQSLPHPGGNSTGITNMAAVLAGKRMEFLKETIPEVSRLAVLWDPQAPGSTPQWQESHQPARELGLELYSMEVSSVDRYEAAFQEAVEAGSDAVWVTLNPLANSNQKLIAELSAQHGLPSVCAREDYAHNGCLLSYGPGYGNEGRDGARYVDRILRGAKPAEIPVEQPMKFEMVVNLRTAEALDRTIPQRVLLQANQAVE
jgi:putative ABC transport system substrate-binding protein